MQTALMIFDSVWSKRVSPFYFCCRLGHLHSTAESLLKLQQRENTAVPLLQRQLADIEKGIENMLNAMQAGILTKSTKKRLDELEAQKEKLELDIMREQIQTEILTKDQIIFRLRKSKELDLTNDDNKGLFPKGINNTGADMFSLRDLFKKIQLRFGLMILVLA